MPLVIFDARLGQKVSLSNWESSAVTAVGDGDSKTGNGDASTLLYTYVLRSTHRLRCYDSDQIADSALA